MRSWSALWVSAALLVACGDAGDVSLTVETLTPSVTVTDGAFGAAVSGGFTLKLTLGSESSGSTEVTPDSFALQSESGSSLIEPLDATPAPGAAIPVKVGKGESVSVGFTLKGTDVDRDAVCAGSVRIVGSLMDSLKGGSVPFRSALITPDCG